VKEEKWRRAGNDRQLVGDRLDRGPIRGVLRLHGAECACRADAANTALFRTRRIERGKVVDGVGHALGANAWLGAGGGG
jgi:hypothetical protein